MSKPIRQELRSEQGRESAMPEQMRPGPVYTPAVDIFETDAAITVLADLPGVTASGLKIDLRENVLTLTAQVERVGRDQEVMVLREYDAGTFYRQFSLGQTIDQERIQAELADGVLRLQLPKQERAKPRQIEVTST